MENDKSYQNKTKNNYFFINYSNLVNIITKSYTKYLKTIVATLQTNLKLKWDLKEKTNPCIMDKVDNNTFKLTSQNRSLMSWNILNKLSTI